MRVFCCVEAEAVVMMLLMLDCEMVTFEFECLLL